MIEVILALLAAVAILLVTLIVWRWTDTRACRAAWAGLASHQPAEPPVSIFQ